MRHETAAEVDRLVQEVARRASATLAECRKTSSETALQLWSSHVAHLLSALVSVVIPLWREHPDLAPKGPIREEWKQLQLSGEATRLCRESLAELRDMVAELAGRYEKGSGVLGPAPAGLQRAKEELDRMEEYLTSSVSRENLP